VILQPDQCPQKGWLQRQRCWEVWGEQNASCCRTGLNFCGKNTNAGESRCNKRTQQEIAYASRQQECNRVTIISKHGIFGTLKLSFDLLRSGHSCSHSCHSVVFIDVHCIATIVSYYSMTLVIRPCSICLLSSI
jgi:hypothetical protein